MWVFLAIFAIVCLAIYLAVLFIPEDKLPEYVPQWEVVPAKDGGDVIGYQIRWSIPDEKGRFLWAGHYFAGPNASLQWCEQAAESTCKRMNKEGRVPYGGPPISAESSYIIPF